MEDEEDAIEDSSAAGRAARLLSKLLGLRLPVARLIEGRRLALDAIDDSGGVGVETAGGDRGEAAGGIDGARLAIHDAFLCGDLPTPKGK